jgi:hypothetical protein
MAALHGSQFTVAAGTCEVRMCLRMVGAGMRARTPARSVQTHLNDEDGRGSGSRVHEQRRRTALAATSRPLRRAEEAPLG